MKKEKIFRGKILGLDVFHLSINGRKIKREVIDHNGAAAILAIDEKENVILVEQERFPYGKVLEIPAGTLEKGEKPIDCAYRELKEETGYSARKMIPLINFLPSIGYNTEEIFCFEARGIKKEADLSLDPDEIISVKKIKLEKLQNMIISGKIVDSKTVCSVLTFILKKNKN